MPGPRGIGGFRGGGMLNLLPMVFKLFGVKGGIVVVLAIGDDRLQKQSQGYVTPDAFTHGRSA
jgi:hypothetical protein